MSKEPKFYYLEDNGDGTYSVLQDGEYCSFERFTDLDYGLADSLKDYMQSVEDRLFAIEKKLENK